MDHYDIALSYASEDESIVKNVYKILVAENINVFYAPAEQYKLIGEDLVKRLYKVYRYESDFITAFVSKSYIRKKTPMTEAFTAIMKNYSEKSEFLIPIYLDSTELPGLDSDITYFHSDNAVEIAVLLANKIKYIKSQIKNSNSSISQNLHVKNFEGNIQIGNNNIAKNIINKK